MNQDEIKNLVAEKSTQKIHHIVKGLDLSGQNLQDMDFTGGYEFVSCNFKNADLRNAKMRKVSFSDCSFVESRLSAADFYGSTFFSCCFDRAIAHHTNFDKTDLRHTGMSNCDFRYSYFKGANLYGAVLSYSDFSWASLPEADLRHTSLRGTVFEGATLTGTVLDFRLREKYRQASCEQPQIIAYRTKKSIWHGGTIYEVGKTYIAPVFSFDNTSECHPGLYAMSSLKQLRGTFKGPYVKVVINPGESIVTPKGYRCKKFTVVKEIPE